MIVPPSGPLFFAQKQHPGKTHAGERPSWRSGSGLRSLIGRG